MSRTLSAHNVASLLGDFDRSPAYRGLADGLRRLMADGRIPAGVRLPSERELTDTLGVSRTTVTRAYAELREAGFLSSRQGSGSVASVPTAIGRRQHQVLHPGLGDLDPDTIDLTCAATSAVPGTLAAFEKAMTQLPAHLATPGYLPAGLPELRERLADRYTRAGLPTDADQIIVTPGALAAVAVALRAAARTGDRALLEAPTYANVIETTRRSGARIVSVGVTPDGWDVEQVAATVRQVAPRVAYTIPDFHNPTGALMSSEDRAVIAAELGRARCTAIVDESMADLGLEEGVLGEHRPEPFAVHLADTITVGSVSKSLWSGLRIGWLRVPRARFDAALQARLSLDLGAAPFEQVVAGLLLDQEDELLPERRAQLRASRDAAQAAFAAHLPEWRINAPRGGLSLWCELPHDASTALAVQAERHGVLVPGGPSFAPEGGLDRHLRVPFTHSPEVLEKAIARLADAWAATTPGTLRRGGAGPTLVA